MKPARHVRETRRAARSQSHDEFRSRRSARRSAGLILIAVHDPDLSEIVARLLDLAGRRVVVTATIVETLDKLRATRDVAVAVIDLAWPQGTAEFREHQLADPRIAAIPTLLVTSSRAMVSEKYSTPILVKPFGFEELVDAIDALLEGPPQRPR